MKKIKVKRYRRFRRYRKLKDINKKFRPHQHMIDEIFILKDTPKQIGAPEETRIVAGKITKRTPTEITVNDSIIIRRKDIGFMAKGNKEGFSKLPECSKWDYTINKWVRLN